MVRGRFITLKYSHNPRRKDSRVAVVISKKIIKRAVGRNRARRRVYEIVRNELSELQPNHDIVLLLFSAEVATMPHGELEEIIKHQFSTARLYKNQA